jgi:hypothetical protein
MALSIQKLRGAPVCPLGFVKVVTSGVPVPLSVNIDANNVNAPGTATFPPGQYPGPATEFTPACRGISILGFKPNNNNSGTQPNSGNLYLLVSPSPGGAGNLSDYGCLVAIIGPAQSFFYPPEFSPDMFSPYSLFLDSDVSGEGGFVVAYGGGNP